jgi:hypothetical protein
MCIWDSCGGVMTVFEMVKYHKQKYPADIPLKIEEVAAHFDVSKISGELGYSLHTEYSYGKRRFESDLVSTFPSIVAAQKNCVPQLWKSEQWAKEFAHFIIGLIGEGPHPRIIEVHPPFKDYADMNGFVQAYSVFEDRIRKVFSNVEIMIENRCGSVYNGGRFLVSTIQDVFDLCDAIQKKNLRLKIALDIPQIYTAHNAVNRAEYIELMKKAKQVREYIGGVHLWGKSRSSTGRKISHCGDLTSYFENNMGIKKQFLESFKECFDDNIVRKMVLEVNSGNADLLSIIDDLKSVNVNFV